MSVTDGAGDQAFRTCSGALSFLGRRCTDPFETLVVADVGDAVLDPHHPESVVAAIAADRGAVPAPVGGV